MDKVLKGARTCMARGKADNAATLLLHLWAESPDAAGLREASVELADRFPFSEEAAEVLQVAAVTSAGAGRLPLAEEFARRAVGVWRAWCQAHPSPKSLSGHVSALDVLASVHRARGDVDAVAACLVEVVEWQYDRGDHAGVAWALRELGVLAVEAGELDRAVEKLARAVELYGDQADDPSVRLARAGCRVLLAHVRLAQGDPAAARALLEAALADYGSDPAAVEVLDLLNAVVSGSGLSDLPETTAPAAGEFGRLSWV